jgi:hypothetical protein
MKTFIKAAITSSADIKTKRQSKECEILILYGIIH